MTARPPPTPSSAADDAAVERAAMSLVARGCQSIGDRDELARLIAQAAPIATTEESLAEVQLMRGRWESWAAE